jgi:hypothetical protein
MLLMVDYAMQHEEYHWHRRGVSVFHAQAWREADWSGRAGILAARGEEWAKGVVFGDRPDDGDGLGEVNHPLLDPLTSLAAVVGLGMAARRWREPACGVLLAAALVLPLGALLTVNDGLYRRTFGLAPFIAVLAALPLAALWRQALAWRGVWRVGLAGGVVLAVGAAAGRDAWAYFGPLQQTPAINRVYPYQLDAAMRAVARLPPQTAVYLYSDRWGAGFETIKWLVPDREVVDRSTEFRGTAEASTPVDLSATAGRPTAFVLLGRYLYLSDVLRERYPDAVFQEAERNGEVMYRVVVASPAEGAGRTRGD